MHSVDAQMLKPKKAGSTLNSLIVSMVYSALVASVTARYQTVVSVSAGFAVTAVWKTGLVCVALKVPKPAKATASVKGGNVIVGTSWVAIQRATIPTVSAAIANAVLLLLMPNVMRIRTVSIAPVYVSMTTLAMVQMSIGVGMANVSVEILVGLVQIAKSVSMASACAPKTAIAELMRAVT